MGGVGRVVSWNQSPKYRGSSAVQVSVLHIFYYICVNDYQKEFICKQCEKLILALFSFITLSVWKVLQIQSNYKYVHFLSLSFQSFKEYYCFKISTQSVLNNIFKFVHKRQIKRRRKSGCER